MIQCLATWRMKKERGHGEGELVFSLWVEIEISFTPENLRVLGVLSVVKKTFSDIATPSLAGWIPIMAIEQMTEIPAFHHLFLFQVKSLYLHFG